MAPVFSSPGALKALYAGNALWFSSAFIHFAFRQTLIMSKLSKRKLSRDEAIRKLPTGDAWHHDVLAYLGAMNTSLAVLAALRLYAMVRPAATKTLSTGSVRGDVPIDVLALVVLGLANCSQAWMNFRMALTNDRWIMGKGFDRITVLDALFTVLDWTAALGRASMA